MLALIECSSSERRPWSRDGALQTEEARAVTPNRSTWPTWQRVLQGPIPARIGWLLVLLLALGAWIYVTAVTRQTEAIVGKALAEQQARSSDAFEGWLDGRIQQARRWADRPDAREMVRQLLAMQQASAAELNQQPLQQAFRAQFALAQGREGVLGYFVISPDGRSLGSLGTDNTGTQNLLLSEPEFFEQMRTRGGALSPLMTSDVPLQNGGAALDGRSLTLFVGVPIYLGGPEPAAYFTLRLRPIGLLAVQGQTRLGNGGVSLLADRHGRLHADRVWLNVDTARHGLASEPFRGRTYLFARDPGRNIFNDALAATPQGTSNGTAPGERSRLPLTASVQAAQTGDGMTLVPYRDHCGVSVVGAWVRSRKLGLAVITEWPAAEAFAPIARARQQVLIAAMAFAVVALGVMLWRLNRSRALLQAALLNAEAASRAKGVFLANMSHEIRTPLNAVLGIAHLMGNTPLSATQQEYLRMISSSGKALLGTLNDILDYSKVEAGKLELLETEFQLGEMVDTLSVIMGVNAALKDLDLIIGIEPEVPATLRGDAQRLLQVLVNLTGNAIKFTSSGQVVLHIAVASRGFDGDGDLVRLRFAVRDTGIGIAPERQRSLFSPFTQAEAGIARDFGGTGLGLAICRRLVELMKGEIGVVSTPGQGSEFWFLIPLKAVAGPQAAPLVSPSAVHDVLVVDDNDIAREFLTKIVERLGWQSHEAGSGAAAIESLRKHHAAGRRACDVLLIDGTMPQMDGLQTSRAIRAIEGLEQPPIVIMVTALGREQVLNSPDADAVDAVVAKPVTPSKIFDAVMEAHTRRRQGYLRQPRMYAPARVVNDLLGLRLLLVEDNYINQQVARGILEAEGAIVTAADHGAQALEMLQRSPEAFDVVLMDVQMPVLDGLAATRRVRRELRLALPIIAMSAGVTQGERDVCRDAGMNDFIAKPLDPQTMVQTIRRLGLSGRSRAHADAARTDLPIPPLTDPVPAGLPVIAGIDVTALYDALNRKRDTVERLLRRLVGECDEVLPKLDAAEAAQDAKAMAQVLHGFKGVAANMRATALAARAAALETVLRESTLAALKPLLPAFALEIRTLREAIAAALP